MAPAFPPFHLHPDVIGFVAALVLGYEYGTRRLAALFRPVDEDGPTRRQRLAYHGAAALVLVVSTWPFHDIGESRLFVFHMAEHLTLGFVVPPLLLIGLPWWFLRALLRPVLPLVRLLTRPIVALVLFNATLAFIHVPPVVELMITDTRFHLATHTALFGTAILMWWPVVDPLPDTVTLAPFGKMGYVFLQGLVPTIPASFMALGSTPLYPIYTTFPRLWGIDVMTDQIAAGFLMKLGMGLLLWFVIGWIFFSWYREERRHDLPPPVVTGDRSVD